MLSKAKLVNLLSLIVERKFYCEHEGTAINTMQKEKKQQNSKPALYEWSLNIHINEHNEYSRRSCLTACKWGTSKLGTI